VIGLALTFRLYIQRRKREKDIMTDTTDFEGTGPMPKVNSNLPVSKLPLGTKTVKVSHVQKVYAEKEVVSDVSFEVRSGEIFGMVGPNGAGKTTTIRMLMDIIKADSGEINILGEPLKESTKDKIGYLPEERGLYRKITVAQSLYYLAQLKNLSTGAAKIRTDEYLQRVGMIQHKGKKIEQLSKGMGQLIQFVTTIIHDPEIVILDEPFAGLDPVNRETLKELVMELRDRGKTVMLSTHQMNEVEELCDRILMINQGKVVLYGKLADVQSQFRNNSIFLECEGSLEGVAGIVGEKTHGRFVELFLDGKTSPQEILSQLLTQGITVDRFEVSTPSLNEIFIQVVKGQ
ncbi:MAG: ATP-binding cassette domain-containing protein, partial [Chloroflexota bacterium]|nr:ATP-binding cassette domain-containing protein [Chloroflexota bacterium]